MRRLFGVLTVGMAVAAGTTRADEPAAPAVKAEPTFLAEFRTIKEAVEAKLNQSNAQFQEKYEAAKTAPEREALVKRLNEEQAKIARPAAEKALAVLLPHAADPAAVEALVWLANTGGTEALSGQAAGLLQKHHLTDKRVVELAYRNKRSGSPWVETLLRAQLAAVSLPAEERPRVLLGLALTRHTQSQMPALFAEMSDDQLNYSVGKYGREQFEALRKLDVPAAEIEAVRLYGEVVEKYGGQKLAGDLTYGAVGKSSIYEIQNLTVGKVAPDIVGEGIDGTKFKLSDSRGKVVLLAFWATWCGPCVEEIPHEREIVARFKGKPFELVGVNGDPDRAKLTPFVEKEKIPWRSFWCGEKGPAGEIPAAWNVSSWPTVYVLDAKGVIRAKNVRGTSLDRVLDRLMTPGDKDKSSP